MWSEYEQKEPVKGSVSPLAGVVRRILDDPHNKLLADLVQTTIHAPSYAPGRAHEDTTYREGYRAFALMLHRLATTKEE